MNSPDLNHRYEQFPNLTKQGYRITGICHKNTSPEHTRFLAIHRNGTGVFIDAVLADHVSQTGSFFAVDRVEHQHRLLDQLYREGLCTGIPRPYPCFNTSDYYCCCPYEHITGLSLEDQPNLTDIEITSEITSLLEALHNVHSRGFYNLTLDPKSVLYQKDKGIYLTDFYYANEDSKETGKDLSGSGRLILFLLSKHLRTRVPCVKTQKQYRRWIDLYGSSLDRYFQKWLEKLLFPYSKCGFQSAYQALSTLPVNNSIFSLSRPSNLRKIKIGTSLLANQNLRWSLFLLASLSLAVVPATYYIALLVYIEIWPGIAQLIDLSLNHTLRWFLGL